jgi:hypothetical protein
MGYSCLGACIMPGFSSFAAVPVLLRSSMIYVPSSWRCPWQYYYVTTKPFLRSRLYRGGRHKPHLSIIFDHIKRSGDDVPVVRYVDLVLCLYE